MITDDVETNPGLTPFVVCAKLVKINQKGICWNSCGQYPLDHMNDTLSRHPVTSPCHVTLSSLSCLSFYGDCVLLKNTDSFFVSNIKCAHPKTLLNH